MRINSFEKELHKDSEKQGFRNLQRFRKSRKFGTSKKHCYFEPYGGKSTLDNPNPTSIAIFKHFENSEKRKKHIETIEKQFGVEPYKCHMLEPSKMRFLEISIFKKVFDSRLQKSTQMCLLCFIEKGKVDSGIDFVDKLMDVNHVDLQLSEVLVVEEDQLGATIAGQRTHL